MNPDIITQMGTSFGPMGLLVGYLVTREWFDAKKRAEDAKQRMEYDLARLDCDKALAAALASLTSAIARGHIAE